MFNFNIFTRVLSFGLQLPERFDIMGLILVSLLTLDMLLICALFLKHINGEFGMKFRFDKDSERIILMPLLYMPFGVFVSLFVKPI
jgi:hypothetical protein